MTDARLAPENPVVITLAIAPALQRRLVAIAARRQLSVSDFVTTAIEEQIRRESMDVQTDSLSAVTDPVLAELWDNPDDEIYDRL